MGQDLVKGIILDFGGVFTKSRLREVVLRRCEPQLGLEKGELRRLLFANDAWRAVSSGKASAQDYWDHVTSELAKVPPALEPFKYNPFAYEELNQRVVRLAKRLRKRYRTALCSNATLHLDTLLSDYGLRPVFDVIVNSARVGLRKPDPQIYRLTAERMGLTVEQCLLVDDKERNTLAAEALGMKAIVFRSAADLARQLDDRGITW